jgi:S1-C subfamily serine protease
MNYSMNARGYLLNLLVCCGLVVLSSGTLFGGEGSTTPVGSPAGFEIPELGVWIDGSTDGPRVVRMSPAANRPEKYRDVDMKVGDRIVSINGQRVATLDEVQKIISAAKPGEVIRIGSLRAKGAAMAVYTVADEAERKAWREAPPASQRVVVDEKATGGPGQKMLTLKMGEGSVPLLELSAVVVDEAGRVKVSQVLPMPAPVKFLEGDFIKSIQNDKPTSAVNLKERLDLCAVGDTITLTVERAGQDVTLTFVKSKPAGNIIYKSK